MTQPTPGVAANPGQLSAQAVVWHGPAGFTLEAFGLGLPRPSDILVQLEFATICGSDRHTVSGRRRSPCPSVLGHEGVGRVVAVGPAANRPALAVGDRVVWSVVDSCGACHRCVAGRSAKCEQLRKVGHEDTASSWGPLSGTYASHIVLPRGVPVPESVVPVAASMSACALATVIACRDAAQGFGGKSVLITGAGMLGICASAVAASSGAQQIVVTDPVPDRLKLAQRFGAGETFAPDALDHRLFDVIVEVSGHPAAVQSAIDHAALGGVVVLAGSVVPSPVASIDPQRVIRQWQTITGVHNYEPQHLRTAVDFLATTSWDWAATMTDPVPLAQVPAQVVAEHAAALRTVVDCRALVPPQDLPLRYGPDGVRQ